MADENLHIKEVQNGSQRIADLLQSSLLLFDMAIDIAACGTDREQLRRLRDIRYRVIDAQAWASARDSADLDDYDSY